jgi:hypothetical protein
VAEAVVQLLMETDVEGLIGAGRHERSGGRFTIHGIDGRPLEELVPECVERVVLPEEAKEAVRDFLKLAGISEFSVFPDAHGAAPFFKCLSGNISR